MRVSGHLSAFNQADQHLWICGCYFLAVTAWMMTV
jgi:hypothetical protein